MCNGALWARSALNHLRFPARTFSVLMRSRFWAHCQQVRMGFHQVERQRNLDAWTDPRVTRSWLALAGAAEQRYTMEMLPALLQSKTQKLLVWGEDDGFQTVDYAERYEREIRKTRLVRIKSAGHIPMENNPNAVAGALAEFFGRRTVTEGCNEGCDPRRLSESCAAAR